MLFYDILLINILSFAVKKIKKPVKPVYKRLNGFCVLEICVVNFGLFFVF